MGKSKGGNIGFSGSKRHRPRANARFFLYINRETTLGIVKHLFGRIGRRHDKRITYTYAKERAHKGAVYLDRIEPRWYRCIDPNFLQIGTGCTCILGQLYGSYLAGIARAKLVDSARRPGSNLSPVEYGFLSVQGICEALQEQDYEHLNQAWQEELRVRYEHERHEEAAWLREIEAPVISFA